MANISPFAKFEVRSSLRSDAIVITTDGDGHSSNVLEFSDQISPRNLGSNINICKCYTRIEI